MTSEDLSCKCEIEEFTLCKYSLITVFLVYLYFRRYFYLDKWCLSIYEKKLLICITLITSAWCRYLVSFITCNVISHRRHFHWLSSSFSMQPSSYMEKKNSVWFILGDDSDFWSIWWKFDDDLLEGSYMKYNVTFSTQKIFMNVKR